MKLSNTKLLDLICQPWEYTNATLMTPGEKDPKPLEASHYEMKIISFLLLFGWSRFKEENSQEKLSCGAVLWLDS